MRAASVLLLLLGLTVTLPALAIYKCESDGKVTYGDAPCDGGKALEIAAPTPSDTDAAVRQAMRERKALSQLEKERHKREAVEDRERKSANRADAAKRKKCDTLARRQERANEVVRTSVGKANERAKLKARHVAEDYEAACGKWPERALGLAR